MGMAIPCKKKAQWLELGIGIQSESIIDTLGNLWGSHGLQRIIEAIFIPIKEPLIQRLLR